MRSIKHFERQGWLKSVPLPAHFRLWLWRTRWENDLAQDPEASFEESRDLEIVESRFHTQHLLRRLRRLRLRSPEQHWSNGKLNNLWADVGPFDDYRVLTVAGEGKVRAAIREEEKARRESRMGWVPLVSALAGLVGTVSGLVAVSHPPTAAAPGSGSSTALAAAPLPSRASPASGAR